MCEIERVAFCTLTCHIPPNKDRFSEAQTHLHQKTPAWIKRELGDLILLVTPNVSPSNPIWTRRCPERCHRGHKPTDTHGNKVLHHVHVRERVDFSDFVEIGVNSFDTGQRVATCDVHSTRAADAWVGKEE